MADLAGIAQSFGAQVVRSITIESNVAPPVVIDNPLGSGGAVTAPGGFDPLRLVRPKVTLDLGGSPLVITPAGEPSPEGPLITALLAAAVLGLAIYGAYCLTRRN